MLFKLGIFTTVVIVISFVVGLRWGVEGVVIAYTVAIYLKAYPVFAIAFRLIDMTGNARVGTAVVSYIGSAYVRDCCVSPSNLARETGSHTRLDHISRLDSCKPIDLFSGPFFTGQRAPQRNRETPRSVKIS